MSSGLLPGLLLTGRSLASGSGLAPCGPALPAGSKFCNKCAAPQRAAERIVCGTEQCEDRYVVHCPSELLDDLADLLSDAIRPH